MLGRKVVEYIIFGLLTMAVNFIVYFTVAAVFVEHTYIAADAAA